MNRLIRVTTANADCKDILPIQSPVMRVQITLIRFVMEVFYSLLMFKLTNNLTFTVATQTPLIVQHQTTYILVISTLVMATKIRIPTRQWILCSKVG